MIIAQTWIENEYLELGYMHRYVFIIYYPPGIGPGGEQINQIYAWKFPEGRIIIKLIVFILNALRPRQNGRCFSDDILKSILWMYIVVFEFHRSMSVRVK